MCLQIGLRVVHAISNGNASDSLKSILESPSTLINEIDTNYFNMDDVFLKEDMFAFLSDQAYAAARAAHKADHNVQKAWKSIGRPNAICPLEQLQQIYDATIEARNSAQKANDAYLNFAKYFDEFRPTIRLIIKYHNVLRNQTIGPIRRSRYKAASKYFDRLQEHLNRLQNCLNILEAYLNVLNTAIITSYTTANLYKSSYNQYKNLADSIQQPKQ